MLCEKIQHPFTNEDTLLIRIDGQEPSVSVCVGLVVRTHKRYVCPFLRRELKKALCAREE